MNAYELAWEEYHRYGEPGWPWHEVIAEHFRHGAVYCTADAFVLARRVNHADPDDFHLSPLQWRDGGDCWMIWLAAGQLAPLIRLILDHPARWVSYQRRGGGRLRRVPASDFIRHVLAKNPEATQTGSSGVLDRP